MSTSKKKEEELKEGSIGEKKKKSNNSEWLWVYSYRKTSTAIWKKEPLMKEGENSPAVRIKQTKTINILSCFCYVVASQPYGERDGHPHFQIDMGERPEPFTSTGTKRGIILFRAGCSFE